MHTLEIQGEMTIYTAAEQKSQLLNALAANDELEINLAQVSELDTAGTQLLLLAKREAKSQQKVLRFTNPSNAVLDLVELANISNLLDAPLSSS